MIDLGRYLPGLGGDDEEDPVSKTLRLLGEGATAATGAIAAVPGQIGQAVSSVLPGPEAEPVPYDPDAGPREALPGSTGAMPLTPPPLPYEPAQAEQMIPRSDRFEPTAPTTLPSPYVTSPIEGVGNVVGRALSALDAANEWVIRSPLGNLSLQAAGRELQGWDQLTAEVGEDTQRLRVLLDRRRAGDTSLDDEIAALTASINAKTGVGRDLRERLLEAGERNPNKGPELAGGLAQGVVAAAVAPSLGAGAVRNVAAAALDPVGQALGVAPELAVGAVRAARRAPEVWQQGRQLAAQLNAAPEAGTEALGSLGATRRPRPEPVLEGGVPGDRGAVAARYADELEAAGQPESSVQRYRALAAADLGSKEELAELLRTVELVTPEEARAMLGERPDYLQPVAAFLLEQRSKALDGRMTARDVAKAYYMTLMSMRSSAQEVAGLQDKVGRGFVTGAGERVPPNPQLADLDNLVNVHNGTPLGPIFTEPGTRGRRIVRPESMGAAWLWTDEGQRALDAIEEGEFLADAWEGGRRARLAFGSDTVGGNSALRPLTEAELRAGKVNMTNLPAFVDELNAGIAQMRAAARESEIASWLTEQSQRLMGIGTGKSAFIKQLLGFGDAVTIDAREINYWLSGQGLLRPGDTSRGANIARAAGRFWGSYRRVPETLQPRIQAAVDELSRRYPELTEGIDPADAGHILHHWLWDRAGGSTTAHTDVMTAQRLAASAGAAPDAGRVDRLGLLNRAIAEPLVGGTTGAYLEQARSPDEDPRTAAARGFAAGAVGFPLATRAAGALGSRAARTGAAERVAAPSPPPPPRTGPPPMAARSLEDAAARLRAADAAVVAAEQAGDPAAIRAADAAYTAVRREYDAAADAAEAARPAVAAREATLEGAGFGRNAAEVGFADAGAAVPGDTRVRGAVPPFRQDTPRAGSVTLNAALGGLPQTAPRRTSATRNVVPQFEDTYASSGAEQLVADYERMTPSRITEAERRAIPLAVDQIVGSAASPEQKERVAALLTQTLDEGERMLDESKVVATGIDGRAIDALASGEGFTNKFSGLTTLEDAVDATWTRVGRDRITREQAREFTERELRADQMVLGEHNLNGRMYAHVTAGPPLVAEAKPAAWFIWDNDTPRVASVHHHYGLGSPDADIHQDTPKGVARALWGAEAVAGARRLENAPGGPLTVGWRAGGVDAGGRRVAETPWAVGASGESRMRMLTQLLAMPGSGKQSLGQRVARGELDDPRQLAAALLRESSAQEQPATEAAKKALGIPPGKAGGPAGQAVAERFKLGSAVNRSRNEALIVDPNPGRVRAIYLAGDGEAYLNEVLEGTGGIAKGTTTRLEAARAAQARIKEMTGRDVPIIFKDTSAVVDEAGEASLASGSKLINDAVELMPDGTRRPLSSAEALAPGRAAIREEYLRAGMTDIGATAGAVPPGQGTAGRLGMVNRALGEGLVGGTTGAYVEQARNPEEDPRTAAARGFAAGAVGFPLATRGARALASKAGAATAADDGQVLASLGGLPQGFNPQGAIRAYQAAKQRNAAQMAASGITAPSPLQWLRELGGTLGYSSLLGPSTFSVNLLSGALEPLWAVPKELTRAGLRAASTGNVNALREPLMGAYGAYRGLERVGGQLLDVIRGRGQYAANPDRPNLSAQTADPLARALVGTIEGVGRTWAGLPDALWGTIAQSAGEFKRAAQGATDQGLSGQAWAQAVDAAIKQARQAGATGDVVDAGKRASDRAAFREELGTIGKRASEVARLGNAPVLGNLVTPFFNTPWNVMLRQAERSPVGLVMNRAPTKFDKYYDALAGSALVAGMAGYAASGGITGSGPKDPQERKMLEATGWKPYSVMVGDTYVPTRFFGYAEGLLNAVGEFHDSVQYQKADADTRALQEEKLGRIGKLIKQQPYAAGIASILDMIDYGIASPLADAGSRLVPGAATLRAISSARDPYERAPERGAGVPIEQEALGRFQQSVGMRSDLPVAQDVLGRPRENPQQGAGALLPRLGYARDDPVIEASLAAGVRIGQPKRELTEQGVTIALTPEEQRRWNELRGAEYQRAAQRAIDSGQLERLAPGRRTERLEQIRTDAADRADMMIRREMGGAEFSRRYREAREKARAAERGR